MPASRRPAARASALVALVAAALALAACGGSSSTTAGTGAGSPVASVDTSGNTRLAFHAPGFALRDENGRLVTLTGQRGKVVLLTWLYTRCPDVCPLIAANINAALRSLGPQADQVEALAVTVDPAHDTQAVVKRYTVAHGFVPQFHFLTGTRGELLPIWHGYGQDVQPGSVDKLVDHTASIAVIDRNGVGRALVSPRGTPSQIKAAIEQVLAQG